MAEQPNASRLRDAERAFMAFRRRRAAGEELDFDAFCREHRDLEEDLRFLNSVFYLGQSAAATVSFRDLLKDQFGGDAVVRLSLEDGAPRDVALESGERDGAEENARVPQRYVLGEEIARGGMSRILRAWDRDLNRTLAMKVQLSTDGQSGAIVSARSRQALERFLEEAHVTAQLDHPGIVPIHDVGFDADGQVYFTMRLVKGRDLGVIIDFARREEDGWNLSRVLGVFLKICETVAFAHARGVIHRDLKPANIMVGKYGETYVMDWGLAKILGREDRHEARLRFAAPETLSTVRSRRAGTGDVDPEDALATPAGTVVGTPVYMAPEQAAGNLDEVNQRSDVYALGAILYRLLAGRPPYVPADGRISPFAVLGKVIEDAPQRVLEIDPSAPPDLVAICEKAMARSPGSRYPDCLKLADDLRAFLDRRVVRASGAAGSADTGKRTHRNVLVTLGAALVVVAVTLGALVFAPLGGGRRSVEDTVLADLQRLSQLQREADELWPASSRNVDALADWLERARRWAEGAADHRVALDRLAEGRNEPLRSELERLVDGLDTFTASDPLRATLASVESRLAFARTVRKNTVVDVLERWSEVGLEPQEGLIPIARNSDSGLWEFTHAQTGHVPGPRREGGTELGAETGLILVLVPGPGDGERFFLSKYKMTRAQWGRIAGPPPTESGGPPHAVTGVSWKECDTVLERLGLTLPTVRQWRYASTGAFGLDAMLDDPREWCRDGMSGRDTFVAPDDRAADIGVRPARAIDE